MKKIAIVGGGAAGLTAAITAATTGSAVELFEQNSRVGKKILASGNGRCNISNTRLSRNDYYGEDPSFVDYTLEQFDFKQFEKFCHSIGLLLNSKEDGRTYPLSDEARSVVLALESYARTLGVIFHNEKAVNRIEKEGETFYVSSGETRFEGYDRVLICTGSEAAPQLGGNGDGYTLSLLPAPNARTDSRTIRSVESTISSGSSSGCSMRCSSRRAAVAPSSYACCAMTVRKGSER